MRAIDIYTELATEQYKELKATLHLIGVFDCPKEDFISKLWSVACYEPRKVDEDTVDIDYRDITATIVYRKDKPELIPEVELVIDGYIMDITIKE